MRPAGLSFLLRCQPPLASTPLSRRCLSTLLRPKASCLAATLRVSSHHPGLRRRLATTTDAPALPKTEALSQLETAQSEEEYHGPLATTFRRLKILSLSSLTLTFALTPFIFVLETTSSVPLAGRFALAGIAMATSSVSTALVAWCGRPYVTTLRFLDAQEGQDGAAAHGAGHTAVEMTTLTLGLHKRVTTVYDTAFLVPTSRPFATWELAEAFRLSEAEAESARAEGRIPRDETIAETRTADGSVIGRRVVSWDEHGVGTCKDIGQVVQYFNVHQELLSRPIR